MHLVHGKHVLGLELLREVLAVHVLLALLFVPGTIPAFLVPAEVRALKRKDGLGSLVRNRTPGPDRRKMERIRLES